MARSVKNIVKPKPLARVLAVEDHPEFGSILKTVLERFGFEATLLPSGEAAIELLTRKSFDLILLDLHMPGMNGLETCRRIKARPELQSIPVIFVSGRCSAAYKEAARRIGAVDVIGKPFELIPFITCLKGHLKLAASSLKDPAGKTHPFPIMADYLPNVDLNLRKQPAARVLVAEDEALMAQIIVAALAYAHIETTICRTGVEALERLSTETYDLILLDIHLPKISGLEVLRQIRARQTHAHVPVVLTSGDASEANKADTVQLGAVEFLQKPFDIAPFLACITGHLKLRPEGPAVGSVGLATLGALTAAGEFIALMPALI